MRWGNRKISSNVIALGIFVIVSLISTPIILLKVLENQKQCCTIQPVKKEKIKVLILYRDKK